MDWRQLDRGALEMDLLHVLTPETSVQRFAFNRRFLQRGSSPSHMMNFGLLGKSVGELNWCRGIVPSDNLLVFDSGGEYESISLPGFNGHMLSFSEEHLDRVAADLELPVEFAAYRRGGFGLLIDPLAAVDLRRHLLWLEGAIADMPGFAGGDRISNALETEIPARLVRLLANNPSTMSQRLDGSRVRAIQRAREYIETSADQAPSVQDVSRVAGVSRRTLNYAFRELVGVTPMRYIQATRLDGARKELQRKGPSAKIADVANTWGFWHMGQFAADYRRQFGELPSDTLQRSGTA